MAVELVSISESAQLPPGEVQTPENPLRVPYLIIDRRGRFAFSRLPEEEVYKASGLEFPRIDPTLDLSIEPRYIESFERPIFIPNEDDTNRDGFPTEERVGKIIGRLTAVEYVRQTEPDTELVDLIAKMRDGRSINVQVKRSHWGVISFYKGIGSRIGKSGNLDDSEYLRRREWMARRNLMVINGGHKREEDIDDEYIAKKFAREVDLLTWRVEARKKFIRKDRR